MRVNGPIKVYNPADTVPTDAAGGYAGGDSTAAAVGTSLAQSGQAVATVDNLAGAATTLPAGSAATVTVTGSLPNKVINIGVPRGVAGQDGMGYAEGLELTAAAQSAQAAAEDARDRVGEFQVTPDGTTFIDASRNLYNPSDPDVLTRTALNAGVPYESASYATTGFIRVTPGKQYTISNPRFWAFYDADKVFIPGSDGGTSAHLTSTVTAPAGSVYMRVCFLSTTYTASFQIEEGAAATAYEPYRRALIGFTGSSTQAAAVDPLAGSARLDGSKWLVVGDSNSILGTSGIQGQSYTTYLPWLTGRMVEVARTATSGNRSDEQLTKVRAEIAAGLRPTMATCMVGTNDLNQEVPIATWQANVTAITQELRAIGCETVLFTLPPRSGPANPKPPSIVNDQWNAWLRTYAATEGFLLFDLWQVVADPATGEHRPGWVDPSDGVHLTGIAMRAVGYEAARQLAPLLSPLSRPGRNMLALGEFTTSTMPSAWSAAGNGWTTHADAAAPGGYAIRLTSDVNPTTRPDFSQRVYTGPGGIEPGNVLELTASFRIASAADVPAGFGMRLSILEEGGTTPPSHTSWCFGQNLPTYGPQTARFQWTLGAGRTSVRILWQYLKPTNTTNAIVADLHSVALRKIS